MPSAESVFASALRRIKPPKREIEESFAVANSLASKLEAAVPPAVEVRLVGSLAKGTWLSGNNEFDIFLLFPKHYSHHEMSMLGLSYARRAFAGMRTESRYAEHPYLQVFSGKYHADIVPAYRIRDISEKGSSVDRSPLHTEYVNSHLDARGKEQVLLLKQFMKNFGIYGAELRVEGFSGYLCELLIIKYGSLLALLKEASRWHEPVLAIEGEAPAGAKGKFNSPLVVIDPTDHSRNVAAVVAETSLSRFIFESRRFLASPSGEFFFSQKKPLPAAKIASAIKARGTHCLLLRFPAPKAVPDVIWPQLKKTAHALCRGLEGGGFSVFGCYHWSDMEECAILFELDRWELPAVKKAIGPSVRFGKDAGHFAKAHAKALNLHIEHDRLVAVEKREERDARSALLRACRERKGSGIPEGMAQLIAKAGLLEGRPWCERSMRSSWLITFS
jgi:tRNA nucleotidyltransferase (CCA-adding enzyme)